jgi:hypothetical protein
MKKILFVCDGDNFPKGVMEFVRLMNENEPLHLKGLFFEPIDFQQLVPPSYIPIAEPYIRLKENEKKMVSNSREKFIAACRVNNISYQVDENDEVDKELLVKESRFADALLISEELFCSDYMSCQPNVFMKEVLHCAECPVMVIPETFILPDRIVLAYDGKKESMIALKQFCYLLPQFTEMPAEFVYIKNEESEEVPDEGLLKEYVTAHFNSSGIAKLHFDAHKYFTAWAETKKNILLVAGSYGRSAVSDLLHSSFAEQVIHQHKIPVFISHHG